MSSVKKVGIIGAGYIAKAHIAAAKNIREVNISGIYDINYQHVQQLKDTVPICSDVGELINQSDAVIIATPNYTHASYAFLAIDKNKHVLCEKPMAANVTEAERMMKKALNHNLCCHVGFNYRFLDIIQMIKQLIHHDEFGSILSIDMELKRSSALTRKAYTWRDGIENNETSGALGDLGTHLIDILHYLFLTEVNLNNCAIKIARYVPKKENIPVFVDDYALISGILVNGIHFRILSSKVASENDTGLVIKIIGTKKEFLYNSTMKNQYLIKSTFSWVQQEMPARELLEDPSSEIYGWTQSFFDQLANWVKCITNDEVTENATFVDGLKEQKVLSHFLSKKNELLF